MDKYQNKFRIQSARLQKWDYGWNGSYFLTICTANREMFFGDVVDGEMELSEIGEIVENEWLKTFEMRPDMNLKMGAFVVMPNHFHAILAIGKNQYNSYSETDRGVSDCGVSVVGTQCIASLRSDTPDTTDTPNTANEIDKQLSGKISESRNQFGPQSKNLASIVRGFKSAVTINARKIRADFAWQPRFHDHIIRDPAEYQRIENYIINNPKKWKEDTFNRQRPTKK